MTWGCRLPRARARAETWAAQGEAPHSAAAGLDVGGAIPDGADLGQDLGQVDGPAEAGQGGEDLGLGGSGRRAARARSGLAREDDPPGRRR
jgi:hypothetical protein